MWLAEVVVPGHRYRQPVCSWGDSSVPTVPGSGSSPSPAHLQGQWLSVPSKLAQRAQSLLNHSKASQSWKHFIQINYRDCQQKKQESAGTGLLLINSAGHERPWAIAAWYSSDLPLNLQFPPFSSFPRILQPSVLSDNVGYVAGLNRKEFSYSVEYFPTTSVA